MAGEVSITVGPASKALVVRLSGRGLLIQGNLTESAAEEISRQSFTISLAFLAIEIFRRMKPTDNCLGQSFKVCIKECVCDECGS